MKPSLTMILRAVLWTVMFLQPATLLAQGTAFTYQGRLETNGMPVNGTVGLRPTLWDASTGGNLIAGNSPSDFLATVTNGLFTATLNFGGAAFNGQPRWLQWEVNPGSGPFTTLSPRQPVTPTPYAMIAGNVSGVIANSSLPASPTVAGTVSAGSFVGSGAGLTDLNASQLTSGTVPAAALGNAWRISGNAGTTPGTHFLGTTDNQALELRVNNQRALRLEDNGDGSDPGTVPDGAPNVLGGSLANVVAGGVVGATISGGGATNYGGFALHNHVSADFGAVGGGAGNRVERGADFAALSGGIFNNIGSNALAATIGGGSHNVIADEASTATIAGGYLNNVGINSFGSTIGGGDENTIADQTSGATIAGGQDNHIGTNSYNSTIGGGEDNFIAPFSFFATISGGKANDIRGNSYNSTIGGGEANLIRASSDYATIGGGIQNHIGTNSDYATISGGFDNTISNNSPWAVIGGGYLHDIGANSFNSTIGGGMNNDIGDNSFYATIGGGVRNIINSNSVASTIAGGNWNNVAGEYATIPGGQYNIATNRAFAAGTRAKAVHSGAFVWADSQDADFASVTNNEFAVRAAGGVRFVTSGGGLTLNGAPVLTSGGSSAVSLTNPSNAFTGTFTGNGAGLTNLNAWQLGGNAGTTPGTHFLGTTDNQPVEVRVNGQRGLRIEPAVSGQPNIIGGSASNTVAAGVWAATIGGGFLNDIGTNSHSSAIGGGWDNNIAANSTNATIAGGYLNNIGNNSSFGAIGGGSNNQIATNAAYATIPGGQLNTATNYAFAAGRRAKANHTGAFVWADSTDADFSSTTSNQFNLRATGGVRLSDNTPALFFGETTRQMINLWRTNFAIGVQDNTTYFRSLGRFSWFFGGSHTNTENSAGSGGSVGMTLTSGGLTVNGTFVSASDRNVKTDFHPVNPQVILEKVAALPLSEWRYQADEQRSRHLGPMAQDFHAAFGLGANDTTIATVDADGVALAAIQGLNAKVESGKLKAESRIERLEAENAALKARLEKLEQLLEAQLVGGAK